MYPINSVDIYYENEQLANQSFHTDQSVISWLPFCEMFDVYKFPINKLSELIFIDRNDIA
jgi:hypothetical protein